MNLSLCAISSSPTAIKTRWILWKMPTPCFEMVVNCRDKGCRINSFYAPWKLTWKLKKAYWEEKEPSTNWRSPISQVPCQFSRVSIYIYIHIYIYTQFMINYCKSFSDNFLCLELSLSKLMVFICPSHLNTDLIASIPPEKMSLMDLQCHFHQSSIQKINSHFPIHWHLGSMNQLRMIHRRPSLQVWLGSSSQVLWFPTEGIPGPMVSIQRVFRVQRPGHHFDFLNFPWGILVVENSTHLTLLGPGVFFVFLFSKMGVSKNRGKTPKMDGENNGKPY